MKTFIAILGIWRVLSFGAYNHALCFSLITPSSRKSHSGEALGFTIEQGEVPNCTVTMAHSPLHQDDGFLRTIRSCETVVAVRDVMPFHSSTNASITALMATAALRRITELIMVRQNKSIANNSITGIRRDDDTVLRLLDILQSSTSIPLTVATEALISLYILKKTGCFPVTALEPTALFLWQEVIPRQIDEFTTMTSPRQLMNCLRAANSFQWSTNSLQYTFIAKRLVKGDALSKLDMEDLSRMLTSLAHRSSTSKSIREWTGDELPEDLILSFLRRLRKNRGVMTRQLCVNVLNAALKLLDRTDPRSKMATEIRVVLYTLANHVLQMRANETAFIAWEAVALSQVLRQLHLEPHDRLILGLHETLERDVETILESANFDQLTHLSGALLELGAVRTHFLRQVGLKLRHTVETDTIEPWVASNLVRMVVLGDPRDEIAVQIFQTALHRLLQNDSFVKKANAVHVSNFLWFMWHTRWQDNDLVMVLGQRMLEADMLLECSTKVSCRLLSLFTNLWARSSAGTNPTNQPIQEQILFGLFQGLGEHLLSINMTALDVSSAVVAYAKASYIQDMGIFDHLVTLLSRNLLDEATNRQVASCLWACGKMAGYESNQEGSVGIDGEPPSLPYLKAAQDFVCHLSQRSKSLSPKDVAQSLWAVGRIRGIDSDDVVPLIYRAQELAGELNSHEIANIVWALSRIQSKEYRTVFLLTRRFTGRYSMPASSLLPTPQEAANILYALGRLNLRDEAVFHTLSNVIATQMNYTSAQAVANVLWAHRAVHIPPPQRLLDQWAEEKLGLVPVPMPQDYNFWDEVY